MTKKVKMTASFMRLELMNRRMELAVAIKDSFALADCSIQTFSNRLGVSNTTLGKIIRGKVEDVALDKLYLIAIGIGLSVNMKVINVNQ